MYLKESNTVDSKVENFFRISFVSPSNVIRSLHLVGKGFGESLASAGYLSDVPKGNLSDAPNSGKSAACVLG